MSSPPGTVPLADQRIDYDRFVLEEATAATDPFDQFSAWFADAGQGGDPEPNAMTLATVDGSGRPSTRIVLIKGFDTRGLVWFTHLGSRKGREIAGNPQAALQFHWPRLQRQVRIEGRVERVDDGESDRYYQSRPLGSRLGAWASEQSAVIADRAVLEAQWAQMKAEHGDNPPRPAWWGGQRLIPDYWEFWQGRPSRLHDRLCWTRQPDGLWRRERLSP